MIEQTFPALRRLVVVSGLVPLAFMLAGCLASEDNAPEIAETRPSNVVRLDPGEIRERISAYRTAHGLTAVTIDPALMALAQSQANTMARADHLSHEIGGSLDRRLNAAHHAKGYAVENVSAGYANADAALGGWQRSPGHNANLLDTKMRRMGIAAADAPGTRFKTYWALMMTD
jgi:uncharacterized protein YkwD